MGQSCNACGKRTSKNYVPAGYAGTACKRCAARDTKRAMDALRVGNWNVYRA